MTVMEREDMSDTRNSVEEQRRQEADLRARKLRGRNLAVLAALLALVVLFYAITVVRMGGAH